MTAYIRRPLTRMGFRHRLARPGASARALGRLEDHAATSLTATPRVSPPTYAASSPLPSLPDTTMPIDRPSRRESRAAMTKRGSPLLSACHWLCAGKTHCRGLRAIQVFPRGFAPLAARKAGRCRSSLLQNFSARFLPRLLADL